MTEDKLKLLLTDLSLDEKIGQMLQVSGLFYGDDSALTTGGLDYFKATHEELLRAGSILSISGAEKLKKLQASLMEKQPHHIPQIFMLDIINGYETIFPVPLGQGATFDPELSERCAAAAAREGAAAGLHVTFSPMCDLCRDARWGRVMESTGEDPFLNGKMNAAMVRGYQGKNVKDKGQLASCIKHFAAYGGAEAGRDYDTVEISERTLRQSYLPAYKEALDSGAKLVMTSFNTLNQVPSTANKWLMRDLLRGEWGFDGVLISDYGALKELVPHGIARDEKEAAELSAKAGVDIDMMSLAYIRNLKLLVEEGKISGELIDQCVWRILKLKNDLGLFENPYKDADPEEQKKICLCPEHRALAREAAAKSFVLLKNGPDASGKPILPINPSAAEKIAFMGPFADNHEVFGSWSFPTDSSTTVTIRQGVENTGGNFSATFCQGSQILGHDFKYKNWVRFTYDEDAKTALLEEAVEKAKNADKVVVCIGEHQQMTGEAASRTKIAVHEEQMDLLRAVSKVNKNIVTLIFAGRPLELEEVSELSAAVMYLWYPGTETGNAVCDVLFGLEEPGGRLPMSFPYTTGQEPAYYNRFRTGRPNNGTLEQTFVNGYIDQIDRNLYSFGFGLAYTSFEYSPVSLSSVTMNRGSRITASVTVRNTGSRRGTETVQMYICDCFGNVVRPVRELKGFCRITLEPGESREVSFEIREEMLRFWNISMEYASEEGSFIVYIGSDSRTENSANFELV
ncbi:MAG: beta-glucosidase BglX [Treponemataceae bacterium]|nr:beta-glucosidase BglX [Treponemataceae bacterium]